MRFPVQSAQRQTRLLAISKDGGGTPTLSGLCADECTITDNGVGDYTINFNKVFGATDFVAKVSSRTDGVVPIIGTKAQGSIQITAKAGSTPEQAADFTFDAAIKFHSSLVGADGNDITIQFADAVTAGSEAVASVSDAGAIVINIEGGVSTAAQVHAALMDSDLDLAEEARNFISSEVLVGATTISTAGATNLTGGVDYAAGVAAECDFDLIVFGSELDTDARLADSD